MTNERQRAYLAVAIAVVIITVSGPLIKIGLLLGAAPAAIAFYRMLGAGLACAAIGLWPSKSGEPKPKFARRDIGLTMLAGLLLATHYLLWIPSLTMTSTFASVLLTTTQPIFSIVGAWIFLKERTAKSAIAALGVAAVGILIIAMSDAQSLSTDKTALVGDLLALMGAMFAAMYFLCGRSARQRVDTMRYLGLLYLTSAAVIAVYMLLRGVSFAIADIRIWLCILGIALGVTVTGHSLLNWALKYLPASVIAVAILGEPLGAAVWALLFFGEGVSSPTLLGGGIVLIGILLYTYADARASGGAPFF